MFIKIKNFIKYNSIASIYLILFILIQSLVSMGLMIYKVMTDMTFADLFLELLGPFYDGSQNLSVTSVNGYQDMMTAYTDLFSTIIIPILLISNLLLIIIILLKVFIKKENIFVLEKINKKKIVFYLALGVSLNYVISMIISIFPKELVEQHSSSIESVTNGNIFLLILVSGIITPIAEELIFRHGIQKNLSKINVTYAIIYQAMLFGLMHGTILQKGYAFVLGLIFGYICYKKGSILYSILLHIAINSSSVILSAIPIGTEIINFSIFFVLSLFLMLLTKERIKTD